jgi:hypothetical protein
MVSDLYKLCQACYYLGDMISALKRFWKRHKILSVVFITTIVLISIIVWQSVISLQMLMKNHGGPAVYGASFSPEQATALGLDWKETYQALLSDLGIKRFRLNSYWDVLEPKQGEYDYSSLDYELEQAKAHGATVTLSIGLRQPRYPECHQPGWASSMSKNDQDQALYSFVTQVVNRYKNDSTIESWQLENEAVNTVFGVCAHYDRDRLISEFGLVKRLDSSRPVIMSVSNEYGLPVGDPRPDEFSLSVYRIVNNAHLPGGYFTYPFTPLFHGLRAAIIERFIHRPVFVGELQAEPWGPKFLADMSMDEQNKSMDAAKLTSIVQYARDTGLSTFDLWGAEWWYWRLQHGDPSVWAAAKQIYQH